MREEVGWEKEEGGNRGNGGVYGAAVVLGEMAHMYRYLKAVRGGDSS